MSSPDEPQSLEQIARIRRDYVDSVRLNNFEGGIHRLLTELYPDNAHFIYELLQNAEDAGATECVFSLSESALVFEHNGTRLFSLVDVDAITSIAASSKADDATAIGKFGVGFKAVFAYTASPEVRSGEFAFRITDLVIPEPIGSGRSSGTNFRFPFNHPEKSAVSAFEEIAAALASLQDETLLFLQNLASIEFSIGQGEPTVIMRADHGNRIISISRSSSGEESASYWLRLEGTVPLTDSNEAHGVAAAFLLEGSGLAALIADTNSPAKNVKVKPLARGQVSIFFPAEKEVSGLRFNIHAPFASTVARDSIRDVPGNAELVDGLASIVCQCLEEIRDMGLLDDGLLAAIPNSEDQLGAAYEPIRDQIAEAFNSERLVPAADGSFSHVNALCRTTDDELRILDDPALSMLTANRCFTSSEPEQRQWVRRTRGDAARFLTDLDIRKIDTESICELFEEIATSFEIDDDFDEGPQPLHTQFEQWIQSKTPKDLHDLFGIFGRAIDESGTAETEPDFGELKLFPLADAADDLAFVSANECFLPTRQCVPPLGQIHPEVFEVTDESERAHYVRRFCSASGVAEWDPQLQFKSIADAAGSAQDIVSHMERIGELIKQTKESSSIRPQAAGVKLLVSRGTEHLLRNPRHIYIDEPFESTGLSETTANITSGTYSDGTTIEQNGFGGGLLGAELLSPRYLEHFDPTTIAEFAESVGCWRGFRIARQDPVANPAFQQSWTTSGRRTSHEKRIDYFIPGGMEAVTYGSHTHRKRLFEFLRAHSQDPSWVAFYQLNQSATRHEFPSQLALAVTQNAWIPSQDGALRRPSDISLADLHPDFAVDEDETIVKRLGFRVETASQLDPLEALLASASNGLLSDDEASEVRSALADPELVKGILEAVRMTRAAKPNTPLPNPTRRESVVSERERNLPERRFETRERRVEVGGSPLQDAAREYLKNEYTIDGDMCCQVCWSELPFMTNQGEPYFEAVEFVVGHGRRSPANRIAACPNCAAMFRFANQTPEDLRDVVLGSEVDFGSVEYYEIDVVLAGAKRLITFSVKHIFDLQIALDVDVGPGHHNPS